MKGYMDETVDQKSLLLLMTMARLPLREAQGQGD
jgi:hypothetical protein